MKDNETTCPCCQQVFSLCECDPRCSKCKELFINCNCGFEQNEIDLRALRNNAYRNAPEDKDKQKNADRESKTVNIKTNLNHNRFRNVR